MIVDPAPASPLFPTAMQVEAVAHEMLVTLTAFGGADWLVQCKPSSTLLITKSAESRLDPAARHSDIFVQTTEFSCFPFGIEAATDQELPL